MSAPIWRELTLDQRNSPVEWLWRLAADDRLDLDPPYQRGDVWGVERQRNLIRSLTIGLPVGGIFLNERDVMEPYVVIDGKQRIAAICKWIDGELEVPSEWFPARLLVAPDLAMTTFDGLRLPAQRGWRNVIVTTYYTRFTGPEAVERKRELFDLINYGGVPQGESDPDVPAPAIDPKEEA